MWAGTATRNITPGFDVPQGGWGAQSHMYAEGVEEQFYATALYLANEPGRTGSGLAIFSIDTGDFTVPQNERIRRIVAGKCGLPPEHIVLSTTHTHAGPFLWHNTYKEADAAVSAYVDAIAGAMGDAAAEAMASATIAFAGGGYGSVALGVNRRQSLAGGGMCTGVNPPGESDPTVGAVRFENRDGEMIAGIMHYGCHPTILGPSYRKFSPDYPGAAKKIAENAVGAPVLFLQGAAGDVGPGPIGFQADERAMRLFGHRLGCEAANVLLDIEASPRVHTFREVIESGARLGVWDTAVRPGGSPELRFARRTIGMPIRKLPSPETLRGELDSLQQEMAELYAQGAEESRIADVSYRAKRVSIALDLSTPYFGMRTKALEIHFVVFGETALVFAPLEPFSRIGRNIREQSPYAVTLLVGYTHGWQGYCPTPEAYETGGYEVETTPFAPEAGERFVQTVVDTLRQWKSNESEGKEPGYGAVGTAGA